jgi:predicted nucleotidyltransferase
VGLNDEDRVRLAEEEVAIIKAAIYRRFRSVGRIILFGSRVDDAKHGGDIDILIESDEPLEAGVLHKLEALCDMHLRLGERKIDFVLARSLGSEADLRDKRRIVQVARKTGVTL